MKRTTFASSHPIKLAFDKLDSRAYECQTPIGRYEIRDFGDRTQSPLVRAYSNWVWRSHPNEDWKDVAGLAEAMVACQTHFDGKIDRCLEPT